jgi:hypothetical protein
MRDKTRRREMEYTEKKLIEENIIRQEREGWKTTVMKIK